MIKRKEKIFQIIGGLFILIVIGGYLFASQQGPRPLETQLLSRPTLNTGLEAKFDITIAFSEEDFPPETELPIYNVDVVDYSEAVADAIASKLGFSNGQKNTLADARYGVVYIWYDNRGASLRIAPKQGIVEYKNYQVNIATGQMVNDERAVQTANAFIQQNGLVITNLTIGEPTIHYVILDIENKEEVSKEAATHIDIQFPILIEQYPVKNDTPAVGNVNVVLNKEGIVTSVFINNVPNVQEKQWYQLKSFDDLKNDIKQARVQMLDNGTIPIYQITDSSISSVTVNKVSIAYFEEQEVSRNTLQPIYVLEGTATTRGGQLPILLYLPAIKSELLSAIE